MLHELWPGGRRHRDERRGSEQTFPTFERRPPPSFHGPTLQTLQRSNTAPNQDTNPFIPLILIITQHKLGTPSALTPPLSQNAEHIRGRGRVPKVHQFVCVAEDRAEPPRQIS